jgi:site-specific DNA recombinase
VETCEPTLCTVRDGGLAADQATADAERIQAMLNSTSDVIESFANLARERLRLEEGGYRRDHLRALAQRVDVADTEVRIMGSKSILPRTLVTAPRATSAVAGVRSFGRMTRRAG